MTRKNNRDNDIKYWLAINQIREIGPKRFMKLINHFQLLCDAWKSPREDLLNAGIEPRIIEIFITKRTAINPDEVINRVHELQLSIVLIHDDEYPALLKEISNPPPLLYYRGIISHESDQRALAVVGTRKISPYGRQITEDLVSQIIEHKIPIVSGLALGVDSCAHHTCVINKKRTIAVLGNGLDTIYPSANTQLAHQIITHEGLLLSEFPLGMPSLKSNFPHRNRIISGLAWGTLVIEAAQKSGSLITAQLALEQNRDVFAVPGSIYAETSQGPNTLIKQGAQPVTSAEDVMAFLDEAGTITPSDRKTIIPKNENEAIIIQHLNFTPTHIDDIIKQSKLDVKKIHSILVTMELSGTVKNVGGGNYVLAR